MNFLPIVIYAFSAIKIMGTEHIALSKMNELLDFLYDLNLPTNTSRIKFTGNSNQGTAFRSIECTILDR